MENEEHLEDAIHMRPEYIYLPICGLVLLLVVIVVTYLCQLRKHAKKNDEANSKYEHTAKRSPDEGDAASSQNSSSGTSAAKKERTQYSARQGFLSKLFHEKFAAPRMCTKAHQVASDQADLEASDVHFLPDGTSQSSCTERKVLVSPLAPTCANDASEDSGCGVLAFLENVTPRVSEIAPRHRLDNDESLSSAGATPRIEGPRHACFGWAHRISSLHLTLDQNKADQGKSFVGLPLQGDIPETAKFDALDLETHCGQCPLSEKLINSPPCLQQNNDPSEWPRDAYRASVGILDHLEPRIARHVSNKGKGNDVKLSSISQLEQCFDYVQEEAAVNTPKVCTNDYARMSETREAPPSRIETARVHTSSEEQSLSTDCAQKNCSIGSFANLEEHLSNKWTAPDVGIVSSENSEAHVPTLPRGECGVPSMKRYIRKGHRMSRRQIRLH